MQSLEVKVVVLEEENKILRAENKELKAEIVKKDIKIKDLENQLNQNSTNSHTAPSKDPIKIKAAKQRKKGGKRGGQEKHVGTTLEKKQKVDRVEIHKPNTCKCGTKLDDIKSKLHDTRQEFDIVVDHIVIEHQRHIIKCPCCQTLNKGHYPEHIKANTQYGINIKSLCLLGNIEYKLPYEKLAQLIADIFKLPMSTGTIYNIIKQGYTNLEKAETQIKAELLKSEVLHADETGLVVDVKLKWMHVLSNDRYTFLKIADKRGEDGFDEIIKSYEGHLVHDFFKSYFKLLNCNHIPCGSHITRELDALIEDNSIWAKKFKKFYYELYHADWAENEKNRVSIKRKFKRIISEGVRQEPPPIRNGQRGRLKKTKGLNLLTRLLENIDSVIEFAFNSIIPFTNNQAERDLRHCKIKQKVSGCFRSMNGAFYYARITSIVSTLKKQSFDIFQSMVTMFRYNTLELIPE
jgi:transposase